MTAERLIARRYLFGRKKFSFINIISFLATVGIMFGVAALIVVMSVFNGFSNLVVSILLDFDPHIKVERTQRETGISEDSVRKHLQALTNVTGLAPFIERKAMITSKEFNNFAWIRGIEEASLDGVSDVRQNVVLGKFDVSSNGIVLGINLADKMHVLVGDTVVLISPAGMENLLTQYVTPTILRCPVVGIFESKNKLYDGSYAFVSLGAASKLFRMKNTITGFELRLKDIERSQAVKEQLSQAIGAGWNVLTWYDLHKDLYSVMKIERWSAFILLCIIIAVAVFNILASLTMLVLEKKRDIGILRTMGLSGARIRKIFLTEGLWIAILGVSGGLALGLGVVFLQAQFGLIRLDQAFIIPSLPVKVLVSDIVAIVISTFALCFLAAWFPAKRAQRVEIIEAIRWE